MKSVFLNPLRPTQATHGRREAVRDAGGYERTTVPLAEFRWADLFRATLAWPESEAEFERLLKKALRLAGSELAVGLPGYTGRRSKPK